MKKEDSIKKLEELLEICETKNKNGEGIIFMPEIKEYHPFSYKDNMTKGIKVDGMIYRLKKEIKRLKR